MSEKWWWTLWVLTVWQTVTMFSNYDFFKRRKHHAPFVLRTLRCKWTREMTMRLQNKIPITLY